MIPPRNVNLAGRPVKMRKTDFPVPKKVPAVFFLTCQRGAGTLRSPRGTQSCLLVMTRGGGMFPSPCVHAIKLSEARWQWAAGWLWPPRLGCLPQPNEPLPPRGISPVLPP